MFPLSRVSSI